jgi:hypothetical protein
VPKGKQSAADITHNLEVDWTARQFKVLCEDLLNRPALRRGPLLFNDGAIREMLSKPALPPRRQAKA